MQEKGERTGRATYLPPHEPAAALALALAQVLVLALLLPLAQALVQALPLALLLPGPPPQGPPLLLLAPPGLRARVMHQTAVCVGEGR